MSKSVLNAAHLHDEVSAIAWVEARIWPQGATCPKCKEHERVGKMGGKSTRLGTYKCYVCRKPFTVKVGTIFEDSHVPMHLWLQAIMLVAASKKGVSANQLGRVLGVTLKTAWFMGHRIRLAMAGNSGELMGSGGGIVEADETYFGRIPGTQMRQGVGHKEMVFALVERGKGVRSFHLSGNKFDDIKGALKANVSPDAVLMTDESRLYKKIGKEFADHQSVNHSKKEYVRGIATTNNVEGFFGVFKRGMTGIYQHCSSDHLHRYLSEFDFRFNNRASLKVSDSQRAENLLRGVSGKRLTYKTVG
jgi:transposase-like protein